MSYDLKLASILLLVTSIVAVTHGTEPVVQSPLGRIKGSLMTTRLNRTIFAFRGVRYGKSTAGERRFKQAVPVEPWTDVFDATKEGPSCPLPAVPQLTSEDCLRLNVYANKLPDKGNPLKRPVIVYFHPGAFYGFSAQSYVFGPQYYLDKDIVLVTVNYRLATFGFIATGDARAPGNLGLKDQVEALRWIQKNIASFGGDPNSVTITGYSAGSWSVIFHMMSPMSKGLFHRGIASSGTPISLEALLPTEQKKIALKQAELVDCPTDSLDKALECLKTVPHQKISDTVTSKFAEWYYWPTLIWSPVVEPEVPGVERFLTAQPIDLIRTKNFQNIPLIIGDNKDEFVSGYLGFHEAALKGNDSFFRDLDENWNTGMPYILNYELCCSERSKHISQELRKAYFKDKPVNVQNIENLRKITVDTSHYVVDRTADLIAQNSHAPVYDYRFIYQGRFSFAEWSDTKKPYGVVHHDDLQYLYYMSFIFPYTKPGDPENAMVDKMTSMWVNFAKTGEPIPKDDHLFRGVTWNPLASKKEYLEIDEKLTLKCKQPGQYAVWDKLFPLPPVSQKKP